MTNLTSTNTTCPYFQPLLNRVVLAYRQPTDDCDRHICTEAEKELEEYIEQQAAAIAPEPLIPIGFSLSVAESNNLFLSFYIYRNQQYLGKVSTSRISGRWTHSKQHFNDNRHYTKESVIAALANVFDRDNATHQSCNEAILSRF